MIHFGDTLRCCAVYSSDVITKLVNVQMSKLIVRIYSPIMYYNLTLNCLKDREFDMVHRDII